MKDNRFPGVPRLRTLRPFADFASRFLSARSLSGPHYNRLDLLFSNLVLRSPGLVRGVSKEAASRAEGAPGS
jgi:hypothetical protein